MLEFVLLCQDGEEEEQAMAAGTLNVAHTLRAAASAHNLPSSDSDGMSSPEGSHAAKVKFLFFSALKPRVE